MTRRFRALWLPALATTVAAEATLYLVMGSGYRPWTIPLDWYAFHAHHPLQFYVPWLVVLPFIAAAGALWSRRQGGTSREAALVAMFPAFAALWLTILATPIDLLVDVVLEYKHSPAHSFCGTAWLLVSFVLAPGAALALGLLGAARWHRALGAGSSAERAVASRG
jgi:hypothetical protein